MGTVWVRNLLLLVFLLAVGLEGTSCKKDGGDPIAPDWHFSGGIIFESHGICVINPAEAAPITRQLVPNGGEPRVSADGKKLLQHRQPGYTSDVFVSNLDGTTAINLTNNNQDASESDADWAPDMQHVAAHALLYPSYHMTLRITSTDGSGRFTDITDTGRVHTVSFPRYAPDGSRIAYIAQDTFYAPRQLAIISSDGKTEQRLGFCDGNAPPIWSPDSKLVAYGDGTDLRLRVVDPVSKQIAQLGPGARGVPAVIWLTNTRLIYCSIDGTLHQIKASTIAPPTATEETTIASGFQSLEAIVLSPHKDRLAIFGRRDQESALGLYLVGIDGSNLHRVATVDPSPRAYINPYGYICWTE